MKYVLKFATGFACDIYAELSDYIFTFESDYSLKELKEEFELRCHEYGEEREKLFKELDDKTDKVRRKKHKETEEQWKERYWKTNNEVKKEREDFFKKGIKLFDITIPSQEMVFRKNDGIFELEHGFHIETLDSWYNTYLIKKAS